MGIENLSVASGGTLADVMPSACALLGVPGMSDRIGLGPRLGDVRRIAVLLIDGLGYHLLPRAAASSPVLADVLAGRLGVLAEAHCGFPSTTPTSLATLGTGVGSGEHGLLGFTVNVPGTDRVLTHVSWRDDPPPTAWQPVPRLLDRAAVAGVRTVVVARPEFAGSGLTKAAYGDVDFVGAARSELLAEQLLVQLSAGPAGERALVYGYHPTLDTTAHLHGIDSDRWRRSAVSVGRLIQRVVDGLPEDAALLVTADHGALDVPAAARIDLADDPRLAEGIRVVAGEPRVRYLHTVAGASTDVLQTWRTVVGERALVLSREQAIATGLFGPVRPEHLARIGDVVVICKADTVVLASGHEPDTVAQLIAFHGSITPEETAIPLLTVRGRDDLR